MRLREQVTVQEADEMGEAVVVAVVRRGREHEQVVALVGQALRELVALRAFHFVTAPGGSLGVGAALVGFVNDDEIPSLLPNPLPHRVLLGVVDGRDHLRFALPKVE